MQSGLANALNTLGREALRIVLPSWCVACRRELGWRERTASCCEQCWSALPKIDSPKCTSCALPIAGGTVCIDCMNDPLPLDWCDAWGEYRGTLESILHAFKFERHDFFAGPLAELLGGNLPDRNFDALVPVPMSRTKERTRGYNQAELLARALSRRVGIDCAPSLLGRRADRETQSTLPKRDRAANVRGVFTSNPRVRTKSILIVDDICTTGETLRACAAALRKHGAARVCAVTVAKAS